MDILESFKRINIDYLENKIGISLFILSILIFMAIVFKAVNPSIWGDEIFTLHAVNKSFVDMINFTANDVHPQFYYIIVKAIFKIFLVLNIPFNEIILGKFISLIPIILLLLFNFTIFRKNFGWLATGIFSLCLVGMPQIMSYGIEIRMYTWAMFFVTMAFFSAYKIIETPKTKYYAFLTLFSILSAYTHHFATISVSIIYLLLFILLYMKNKKEIKNWIKSVAVIILMYLPYFLFMISKQISLVTNQQTIAPMTIDTIQNVIWFILSPYNSPFSVGMPSLTGIGLIIAVTITITYFLSNQEKIDNFLMVGMGVLILTVIVGITISIVLTPIFISRYVVPSLGCFWLGFSILMYKIKNKKEIFLPVLLIILIASVSTTTFVIGAEHQNNLAFEDFNNVITKVKKGDVIVTNYPSISMALEHYFLKDNKILLIFQNDEYTNNKTIKQIKNSLNKNKTVYAFLSEWDLNNFNMVFNGNGLKLEEIKRIPPASSTDISYPHIICKIYKE